MGSKVSQHPACIGRHADEFDRKSRPRGGINVPLAEMDINSYILFRMQTYELR